VYESGRLGGREQRAGYAGAILGLVVLRARAKAAGNIARLRDGQMYPALAVWAAHCKAGVLRREVAALLARRDGRRAFSARKKRPVFPQRFIDIPGKFKTCYARGGKLALRVRPRLSSHHDAAVGYGRYDLAHRVSVVIAAVVAAGRELARLQYPVSVRADVRYQKTIRLAEVSIDAHAVGGAKSELHIETTFFPKNRRQYPRPTRPESRRNVPNVL
jgi:hypothetical protein